MKVFENSKKLNWIENWKNLIPKNWKSEKIDLVVRYTDKVHRRTNDGRHGIRVYFVNSILNCIFWLKIDFYSNFQFNLLSNSLIRFWILEHKSIIEIQFLKWKLKIQFSILNFWRRKYFTSNPAFNKKSEIPFSLVLFEK